MFSNVVTVYVIPLLIVTFMRKINNDAFILQIGDIEENQLRYES